FTNTGATIQVAADSTFIIKSGPDGFGTVVFDQTTLQGAGTIDLGGSSPSGNSITTRLEVRGDLRLPSGGPTLSFSGDVEVAGPGRFINAGTFEMTADHFLPSVEVRNEGTFIVLGGSVAGRLTNEIQGTFTSVSGSTLRVQASRADFDARLVMANGFTN